MSKRTKRVLGVTATLAAVTAATAAVIVSSASGTVARAGAAGAKPKVAIITLYREPLAQQMAAGAKLAAQQYGADFHWVGPPGLNPPAEIKMLQDEVAAGTQGIVLMMYPPELFARPINQAIEQGVTVVTADVGGTGSKATTHLGPGKTELGIAEAQVLAKQLGPNAKGYIQPGICVPGLPVLVVPFKGVAATLKRLAPGVVVKKELNVTGDPATNFIAWQRIMTQNTDALGFIGNCDQDAPNLIKVKKSIPGAKFVIGDTSGDSPEVLKAVKSGAMTVLISQSGFVDGYSAMKLVLEKLVNKKALPQGWLDVGIETITKANADSAIKVRQQIAAGNLQAGYAYYKRAINRALTSKPKPLANYLTEANRSPLATP